MAKTKEHRIERIATEAAAQMVDRVHKTVDFMNSPATAPPFQTALTQKEQLMRYRRMTPDQWEANIAQHGPGKPMLHWAKMERLAFRFAKEGKEIFDTEPPEEAVI